MPLHLLGKKSWNVYNADNIARVKADEAAAAEREAADDQRMQELDAERRAAILRGQTPPPLPEPVESESKGSSRHRGGDGSGRERKRRKLAGEDDTDMDIRLASSTLPKTAADDAAKILQLRSTASDAPIIDHAGHIDLFPVDMKEAIKREKNAEVEKEKRKKEKALEDQYTMRFSNAAGRGGVSQPWYIANHKPASSTIEKQEIVAHSGFEDKDVWGNEDPRRKERQQARISTSDPFAFMQQAQAQLQKSKLDKQKWAEDRDRELKELRATQEREERLARDRKRKKRHDVDIENPTSDADARGSERNKPSRDIHRRRDRSHRREHGRRSRSRSRSKDRSRDHDKRSSSRRHHRHHNIEEQDQESVEKVRDSSRAHGS